MSEAFAPSCAACPSPAVVFVPGTEAIRELFMLKREKPDQCFCLGCAVDAGWPWLQAETSKQRRG